MRIAYLSNFYPYRGGIAHFNNTLFKEFAKSSEIKAYNFKRQYPKLLFPGESQYVDEDYKADKIESERILDSINPINYFLTARRIASIQPNLFITSYWMPFFGPSLGYIAGKLRKKGTKTIAILHNVIPHEKRPGDDFLTNYFLKKYDGFVALTDAVKNDLLSIKPDAKCIVSPHPMFEHLKEKPLKSEAKDKLGLPKDKKILLFFGFIRDYKGLDLLLKSMADLSEDYHLLIAGEVYGPFDKYQGIIDSLGLNERVTKIIRYIKEEEIPEIFSASDVTVLPYKSATQSGIVGISYNYDVPVIATDKGGLSEMIKPWGTGLMVENANSQELAEKIKEFFNSENDFQARISEYKREASWSKLAERILELYKSI